MIIKKTIDNPHGLSTKQKLVIEDMAQGIKKGKGLNQRKSHAKIYNTTSPRSASVMAHDNMVKPNFREALLESLENKGVLGVNGKVAKRLSEGLDAKDQLDNALFSVRLSYIQEINKVTGVYAPTKIDQRTLRLSGQLPASELKDKVDSLRQELEE